MFGSGSKLAALRTPSHWLPKLSTSAFDRGSRNIRRTCCSSTAGSFEPPALGQVQQLFVRNAAPQKKRQARREIDVAEPVHGPARRAGGIALDAEQEIEADEHALERRLNPGVERRSALSRGRS